LIREKEKDLPPRTPKHQDVFMNWYQILVKTKIQNILGALACPPFYGE